MPIAFRSLHVVEAAATFAKVKGLDHTLIWLRAHHWQRISASVQAAHTISSGALKDRSTLIVRSSFLTLKLKRVVVFMACGFLMFHHFTLSCFLQILSEQIQRRT